MTRLNLLSILAIVISFFALNADANDTASTLATKQISYSEFRKLSGEGSVDSVDLTLYSGEIEARLKNGDTIKLLVPDDLYEALSETLIADGVDVEFVRPGATGRDAPTEFPYFDIILNILPFLIFLVFFFFTMFWIRRANSGPKGHYARIEAIADSFLDRIEKILKENR